MPIFTAAQDDANQVVSNIERDKYKHKQIPEMLPKWAQGPLNPNPEHPSGKVA